MRSHGIPGDHLDGHARILADAFATGRGLTREELESRRARGERAADAGYGPRALVGAHLAATRAYRTGPAAPASAESLPASA
ncbi:hypothetical protein [Streptomyces flavofungini]|uniref:hypothetical protein n=1 Tax=Streptomyces flavofungini TaxID=68200 RepID=UPI003F5413F4